MLDGTTRDQRLVELNDSSCQAMEGNVAEQQARKAADKSLQN
jgi:hypothetical protein